MSWDSIVVILLVLIAALYVLRRFVRARQGVVCCSKGCGGACSLPQSGPLSDAEMRDAGETSACAGCTACSNHKE